MVLLLLSCVDFDFDFVDDDDDQYSLKHRDLHRHAMMMMMTSWTEKMAENAMNHMDHRKDGNKPMGPYKNAVDTAYKNHLIEDDASMMINEMVVSMMVELKIDHEPYSNCSLIMTDESNVGTILDDNLTLN